MAMLRVGRHAFTPDMSAQDWRGERVICAVCPLPKNSEIHLLPETPEDDVTARILGEGTEENDGS